MNCRKVCVICKKQTSTYCYNCSNFPFGLECPNFVAVCEQSNSAKSNCWFVHTGEMREYEILEFNS